MNIDIILAGFAIVQKAEYMVEYLKRHFKTVAFIRLVPPYFEKIIPTCFLYHKHKVIKKFRLFCFRGIQLNAVKRILVNLAYGGSIIYAFLRLRKKCNLYLGLGWQSTFVGVLLKKIGFCRKVIYYSGDYFPRNEVGDRIFRFIDRLNINYSDAVWNGSGRMVEARKKNKVYPKKEIPQLICPLGVERHFKYGKKNKSINSIVYMGRIERDRGLDLILQALPFVIKKIPDLRFHIIGTGNYKNELEKLVNLKRLNDYVIFHGIVSSQSTLKEIFSRCSVGIALYAPNIGNLIQYTEPGKVKDYLSYGLPIIINPVPEIASEIKRLKAGLVIDFSESAIQSTLLKLFTQRGLLKTIQRNAVLMASRYSWNNILNKAFKETFTHWQTNDFKDRNNITKYIHTLGKKENVVKYL